MTILATDDFNRANAASLGANWTDNAANAPGTFKISSNAAVENTGSTDAASIYNAVTWPNNQYSQVTLLAPDSRATEAYGVICRSPSNSAVTYYRFVGDAAGYDLERAVNSTYTQLIQSNQTFAVGDTLGLWTVGNTLTLFKNGTAFTSVGDSNIPTGNAGIGFSSTATGGINAWEGGTAKWTTSTQTVAVDARSTAVQISSSGATVDHTSLTVGTGTNRALVVMFNVGSEGETITSVTWDQGGTNQLMRLIGSAGSGNNNVKTYMYGLIGPVSGNKTLRIVKSSTTECEVYAIAYTGVTQLGSFDNFTSDTKNGTSGNASIVVTSAVGDWTQAMMGHNSASANIGARSPTEDFFNTSAPADNVIGWDAAGAATNTFSVTLSSTNIYALVGCDIVAAGSAEIALAAAKQNGGEAAVSTLTLTSFSAPTGTVLLFSVILTAPGVTATSAAYNGVTLTQVGTVLGTDSGVAFRIYYFMAVTGADGSAHNMTVTLSGSVGGEMGHIVGTAWTGVESSSVAAAHRTVYTAASTGGGSGGTPLTVIDSVLGDVVVNSVINVGTGVAQAMDNTAFTLDQPLGSSLDLSVQYRTATSPNSVMRWETTTICANIAMALVPAQLQLNDSVRSLLTLGPGTYHRPMTGLF